MLATTAFRFILILWAIFFSAVAFANGGGGPVGGGCRFSIGDFTLMFSAYQPQLTGDAKFCTEIPGLGSTNLVLDYESLEGSAAQKKLDLDRQIREMTIEVEVKKGDQNIFKRPSESFKKGIIESIVNFQEPGEYLVEVKLTDPSGKTIDSHLPLKVGSGAGASLRNLIIAVAVIVAAVYLFYLSSAGFREKVGGILAKIKK